MLSPTETEAFVFVVGVVGGLMAREAWRTLRAPHEEPFELTDDTTYRRAMAPERISEEWSGKGVPTECLRAEARQSPPTSYIRPATRQTAQEGEGELGGGETLDIPPVGRQR